MNTIFFPVAVFVLGFVFATMVAEAQLPLINFEVITSKNGLPSNTVLSATRDRQGFMWFGTRQCPVRYDGVSFKAFTDYTTNFVTGIQADKSNNIWFASDRSGVSVIDSSTRKMRPVLKQKLDGDNATGFFFIDSRGDGWYSDHQGVNRIDLHTHRVQHYPFRQTSFVWTKASFLEDVNANLWVIGRDNGLFKFDRDSDTLLCVLGADNNDAGQYKDLVMSAGIADAHGYLWLATYNYGLLKFNTRSHSVEAFATGRQENEILAVEEGEDENGNRILWVGDNLSVGVFRPEQKKFFFFEDILARPYQVFDIYRDQDKIVWICTSDGILKYHPAGNTIQTIEISNELMDAGEITFIHQDRRKGKDHLFYLGMSNNTLLIWDRLANEFTRIEYPAEAAETKWIRQDANGLLWIGTNRWDYVRPGIFLFDPATLRFSQNAATRKANQLFSVPFFMYGQIHGDRLWVGNSDEGIHAINMNGEEVTPWSKDEMQSLVSDNNLINDMILDDSGKIFIGAYAGIFQYDDSKKVFINIDPAALPDEADDQTVNSLLLSDSCVWAARWGSLTRTARGGEMQAIGLKSGFADREIKGLAIDYKGDVWIGNHEGLYCYQTASRKLIRFTMNDGLVSNNTCDRIFSTQSKRELLIGHDEGLNIVNVNALAETSQPPRLVITSFKVHQSEYTVDASKGISLTPDDNVFSVDFVALNYRKQDDNQYAYYLEGFESEWNDIGSNHMAYYTNLNPGQYVLHLRARDSRGNWNGQDLHLSIEVMPAFYQTAWFKLMIIVLVSGALYAFYRYRINQLLHLQQVRNRISADLHDELGSTLSGISIMGTLAQKHISDPVTSGTLVERIMDDVRQISGSLDDIVWNISPKNDSLSSLVARMTRYSSELFEAKEISFNLSIPKDIDGIRLSMEQRRNIYLIFKESVNNLVKYSLCSQASVKIEIDHGKLHLTVQDNGVGFDPSVPTDRNGLRNLHDRARKLKARIDIRSAKGEGTSISLLLPI